MTTEIVFFDSADKEIGRVPRGTPSQDPAHQSQRDSDKMKAFKAAHPETASAKIFFPSGSVMTEFAEETPGGEWVNKSWLKK